MKPKDRCAGSIDGVWSPRTRTLGEELPELLAVLTVRLGPNGRAVYDPAGPGRGARAVGRRGARAVGRRGVPGSGSTPASPSCSTRCMSSVPTAAGSSCR
ncbi:DUF5994 family protein [Rhodococcus koreensis]|uniref:DUF5994 family protein n=1 Tax=Rhodococcus koreensis TaxID=99653 RepID=UPI001F123C65|nr:DUF5994 family protein [Rhodococcus koreensis]